MGVRGLIIEINMIFGIFVYTPVGLKYFPPCTKCVKCVLCNRLMDFRAGHVIFYRLFFFLPTDFHIFFLLCIDFRRWRQQESWRFLQRRCRRLLLEVWGGAMLCAGIQDRVAREHRALPDCWWLRQADSQGIALSRLLPLHQ